MALFSIAEAVIVRASGNQTFDQEIFKLSIGSLKGKVGSSLDDNQCGVQSFINRGIRACVHKGMDPIFLFPAKFCRN